MDEEREEDGKAQPWIGVVSGEGDEAFGEFVQGYCHAGLQANGEKGIGGDVVVVLSTIRQLRVVRG